jgi:hypothetical protein
MESQFFTGNPLELVPDTGIVVPNGIAANSQWSVTVYAHSLIANPTREIAITV